MKREKQQLGLDATGAGSIDLTGSAIENDPFTSKTACFCVFRGQESMKNAQNRPLNAARMIVKLKQSWHLAAASLVTPTPLPLRPIIAPGSLGGLPWPSILDP